MKIRDLILKLCRLEKNKKQVNIAQMSEVVGVLSDLIYKNTDLQILLLKNGERRAKKKKAEKVAKKLKEEVVE